MKSTSLFSCESAKPSLVLNLIHLALYNSATIL